MPAEKPAAPTAFASIEELIASMPAVGVHLECGHEMTERALRAVRRAHARHRCAFYLESDRGFDRESVASYLRFFSRLAGSSVSAETAVDHFGLRGLAKARVAKLTAEQRAMLNFARLSLFEPEICFCERPLGDLGADARRLVLQWMVAEAERGVIFITTGQPLREALLMPGGAWWVDDDGQVVAAQSELEGVEPAGGSGDSPDDEPAFVGDEVAVCKIACKVADRTMLFDPREIDFIESSNRQNFASVRGELYPTAMTMDELEAALERYGFFRCHRSFIVNVQKVRSVERYTRNSFNLSLSDAAQSSIPLAKGRAEAMRERFGW